jgi:hypothetical protein
MAIWQDLVWDHGFAALALKLLLATADSAGGKQLVV